MTPAELEYVNSLIGRPYKKGALGPEEFDCFSLVKTVSLDLFGHDMPDVLNPPTDIRELMEFVREHPHRRYWRMVDKPVHGGLVEMCRNRNPFHIGLFLDVQGGGILHANYPVGVCWDRQVALEAAGWRRFIYHEWAG